MFPALPELGHVATFAITTSKVEFDRLARETMYKDEWWWHRQRT